ncbi:sodium- and chloride-dependent GABA transporter ine isoform X1 [Cloeon dipterum]|uniref:sodium- and chloride-dependent GABA transporter ine isoform X1 n=1 Tax=Cloeon dipterum TaxID=197152 RepID=UPI0032204BE4
MENGTPSVARSAPIPIVVNSEQRKETRRIFFEGSNGHHQHNGANDEPEEVIGGTASSFTGASGTQFTVTTVRTPDPVPDTKQEPLLTPPHGLWNAFNFSDPATQLTVQSIASMGMGCTDGKKLYLRRVPTTASELISMVNPIARIPADDDSSCSSFSDSVGPHGGTYRLPRRQHWSSKVEFVLACVGYSVGLGNVWRFPYLCYKSGGGVFLVPYFLILVICGIPMLYMELAVGQYTRRGPIGAIGKLCPLLKGAGLSSVVVSFIMSTYYNVVIAWALYYFFTAFKWDQPWKECGHRWNSDSCWLPSPHANTSKPNDSHTPSQEFFDRRVLQMTAGIDDSGTIRWELVACLVVAWLLVYFSLWKGVKSSGKVFYMTATFPYLMIFAFLARALTLEGALEGLRYFFQPKWELLAGAEVWINAAAQIFNSMGIAFGSVISFASYNRFNNQIVFDTFAVSLVNALTSILVGIFAFATIGNIAWEQNTSVDNVVTDGPGLIFVVYPQALAQMPLSQFWSVLFFFMLLCLGLDSQFAIVEVVVTSIKDGFPNWIKRHMKCHEVVVFVICLVSFLFGLPNVTQGGIYFFQLIDHYAASISIMYVAFFEIIAVSWFYGAGRLARNVQEMTGRLPSLYFRFCWWIAAPVLLMAVWVFSLIDYTRPTFNNGTYLYPPWAEGIGWIIASLSLICIPLMAIIVLVRMPGKSFWEKLRNSVKSHIYECPVCGSSDFCEHAPGDERVVDPVEMELTPKTAMSSPMTNGLEKV